jgi:hypothetical protein
MAHSRPRGDAARAHISPVDRLEYFLRSRASKVVVLSLVANTMVAQLLYNSAGQLVLGNQVLLGCLLISAVCSTVAFALFEAPPSSSCMTSWRWMPASRRRSARRG